MTLFGGLISGARMSIGHYRAKTLAKNDYKLLRDLVSARRAAGLTQGEVAERMGVSQQAISKLERYDSDPKLSTLRRYAHAVEAMVEHTVNPAWGQTHIQGSQLVFLTSLADSPMAYPASKRTNFALAC